MNTIKTIKFIKFDKCRDCPNAVIFMAEKRNYYCPGLGKEVNAEKIDKDCKLMDYPKTVTEFLGGKI